MPSGKLTFIITVDASSINKTIRKAESDAFFALFDDDDELQLIKNINNITDSSDDNDTGR